MISPIFKTKNSPKLPLIFHFNRVNISSILFRTESQARDRRGHSGNDGLGHGIQTSKSDPRSLWQNSAGFFRTVDSTNVVFDRGKSSCPSKNQTPFNWSEFERNETLAGLPRYDGRSPIASIRVGTSQNTKSSGQIKRFRNVDSMEGGLTIHYSFRGTFGKLWPMNQWLFLLVFASVAKFRYVKFPTACVFFYLAKVLGNRKSTAVRRQVSYRHHPLTQIDADSID